MRAILFLIFLSVLVGCGRSIPPEFQPYVDKFLSDAQAQGRTGVEIKYLDIKFGEIGEDGVDGDCETGFLSTPTITIVKRYWDRYPESLREVLLYHELGHCILGRGHRDDQVEDGYHNRPVSIMNTYLLASSYYLPNRADYIRELFGN